MFAPSANFHAKNMHVCTRYLGHLHTTMCIPNVWAICQLPHEEYACVHPISAHYQVNIYAHICHEECVYMLSGVWATCQLPCEEYARMRSCILPTSVKNMHCVCAPAADFMCVTCASMCIYVMRTSDVWATCPLQCEDGLCVYTHVGEINHHIKKVFIWKSTLKVPFALCFTVAFVLALSFTETSMFKKTNNKNI